MIYWRTDPNMMSPLTTFCCFIISRIKKFTCCCGSVQSQNTEDVRMWWVHQWHTCLWLMCYVCVLTTFWRHLWSTTEQTAIWNRFKFFLYFKIMLHWVITDLYKCCHIILQISGNNLATTVYHNFLHIFHLT